MRTTDTEPVACPLTVAATASRPTLPSGHDADALALRPNSATPAVDGGPTEMPWLATVGSVIRCADQPLEENLDEQS